MKITVCFLMIIFISSAYAQESGTVELPYQQIPDYPEDYTPGNVIARFIDGLGYRYYWATEGLTEEDLNFIPSEGARSTYETIVHIYRLSETIVNAPQNLPNISREDATSMSFATLREKTLFNLKKASDLLHDKSAEEIANFPIIFQRGENKSEFPYWHMINGPIADAIYHTGQIVSYRRSSGNPIHPKVNVFMGKTGN